MKKIVVGTILSLLATSSVYAAEKPIKGTLGSIPSTGTKLLAIADDGRSSSVVISKKAFSIVPPGKTARLYLLKDGKITGQLVVSKCRGSAKKPTACSKTQVYTAIKAGKDLGALSRAGLVYVSKAVSLGSVNSSDKVTAKNFVPIGLGTTGLPVVGSSRASSAMFSLAATSVDIDRDGLVEALDADDNNNGVIDNYDSSKVAQPANSFRVFSNLKLDMDESINLHATGLSTSVVDLALRYAQTLAIEVAGGVGETTELDCGGLTYCSAGGTGASPPPIGTPFPYIPGGVFDPDGDGFGSIEKGPTGDFQLKTGATSSSIAGGDTLIERVTSARGAERQIPGVLNFVFTSTPALKTIGGNSIPTQTIDYALTSNRIGSFNNCVTVPATGPVVVTLSGWRPQRPGVAAAGEGAYVDIGNSLITIDIPNAPSALGTGSPSRGPGNCVASAYQESDPNLSIGSEGLQDNKGDVDASASNTFEFAINVTDCLAAAQGGAISWAPGEQLQLDLQFRSRDGDNAAQKFCLTRAVPEG